MVADLLLNLDWLYFRLRPVAILVASLSPNLHRPSGRVLSKTLSDGVAKCHQ